MSTISYADLSPATDQRMRAAKGIEEKKEAELKGVLSPDQFQKFLAGKDEMRDQLVQRIKEQRAHGAK